jgi:hypothetical protein
MRRVASSPELRCAIPHDAASAVTVRFPPALAQRGGKPHGHRARGVEDLATRRVVVVAVAVAVVVVVAVVRARGGGRLRRRLRRALRRPLLLRELHPARRERGWTRRDAGEGAREI